jgi:hypothetical protein
MHKRPRRKDKQRIARQKRQWMLISHDGQLNVMCKKAGWNFHDLGQSRNIAGKVVLEVWKRSWAMALTRLHRYPKI